MLTIAIASILGITLAVWLVNKALPFQVCPICAGVSGTWMWMLGASFLGYEIDLLITTMLLGATVVGIAYQLEKKLPAGKSPLLWKTLFIPTGFVAAYSLAVFQWAVVAGSLGVALALAWGFLKSPGKEQASPKVEEHVLSEVEGLKKKMENCC